ncbi:hypothetical protein BI344_18900 [Chromobacterium sphagni]|uniref:Secreted protein n=1 Tax=Chromobacterium sphagni TaxID=1903179 RepID=A0ABX3CAK4_9NEIS|nr:hypothetical protein BI344_18900 [Chromobacterium sphagni]
MLITQLVSAQHADSTLVMANHHHRGNRKEYNQIRMLKDQQANLQRRHIRWRFNSASATRRFLGGLSSRLSDLFLLFCTPGAADGDLILNRCTIRLSRLSERGSLSIARGNRSQGL